MSAKLQARLTQLAERDLHRIVPLSGGSVGEVYRADFHEGPSWVVKVHSGPDPNLHIEGYMLTYLKEHSALPVPQVYHLAPDLLVMEWKAGESAFSHHAEVHAAKLLADLHTVSAPHFGLERDTLIGSLHQPNTPTKSWVTFFRERRLLYMANRAVQEKRMGLDTMARLERFASNLDKWIREPVFPSLLHGDVWTTNVLAQGDHVTAFLDPAISFGHPEIELAFITLFNTFGERFFDAYHELHPIGDGFFQERKDIYNLYPLLVHVRLFGGGYLASVESTLRRFGY
jgi:fructosamine-3-kinase